LLLDGDASLLAFQRRVFEEAQDDTHPLLERVKFLAILSSNLRDFMTRGDRVRSPHALAGAHALMRDATEYLHCGLMPALAAEQIHVSDGDLWRVAALDRPTLHDAPLAAHVPDPLLRDDIFEAIRDGDVLLHHPFDSFQPVVSFLHEAATDPKVTRVEMTLYRTEADSQVGHSLLEACRRGKRVTAVVEPRARRDEENNAAWAQKLEAAGARVIYGVPGVKVHAKVALVTRSEGLGERRYAHISSGNYHAVTARTYTDFGLFTCDDDITDDVSSLFDLMAGGAPTVPFQALTVAPFGMRSRLRWLIEREIMLALRGEETHIVLKMNGLSDPDLIALLCRASQAGVQVDLIVRGLCLLRPGIRGVSDAIRVRSVVGRFLEHSRAWYFLNGGDSEAYIGSADLMPRNLDRRIEVVAPIYDTRIARQLCEGILATYLADNVKARELGRDGTYSRVHRKHGDRPVSSQSVLGQR
jgi:polyphosphate kinase